MSAQLIGYIIDGELKRTLTWSNEGHQPCEHGEALTMATAMLPEEA